MVKIKIHLLIEKIDILIRLIGGPSPNTYLTKHFNLANFLLCSFKAMVGWIDVHSEFNGGEPQRLKVRCLNVTLRGLKD